MADEDDLPALAGASWRDTGDPAIYDDGDDAERVPRYRLEWDAEDEEAGEEVQVPQDCITTAELVAAWLNEKDLEGIGEVNPRPRIAVANADTPLGPGDILLHVHSRAAGDFHAAGVIAEDDPDVVTMEADASEEEIGGAPPLFDMYAGHSGFRDDQHEGGADERTYVIHLDQRKRMGDSLWAGIQKEIEAGGYNDAGVQAAEAIKAAIANAVAMEM